MLIGRQLSLILASFVLVSGVVGCSDAGDESVEASEPVEASESVEVSEPLETTATDQSNAGDEIEKGTPITLCFNDEFACEQMRQFLEGNNNDCGQCELGGECGDDLFTLTCVPEA
jgi:hypothetical protein